MSDLSYPGESANVGNDSYDDSEAGVDDTTSSDLTGDDEPATSHGADVEAGFDDEDETSESGPAGL